MARMRAAYPAEFRERPVRALTWKSTYGVQYFWGGLTTGRDHR